MSFWFPKIEAAGLPVPRTRFVEMSDEALRDIFRIFDREEMVGDAEPFFRALQDAALEIGFPVFLRSSQTSDKHEWSRTCFVTSIPCLKYHVENILYFSACVGIPETKIWAVREMLPIEPVGICLQYGGMPVNREFRYFVDGGEILCTHPYWPRDSLNEGGFDIRDEAYAALCEMPGPEVAELAAKAGAAVGGRWSVDLLETRRGWYVTDMAEAHKSFHWKDCTLTPSTPLP